MLEPRLALTALVLVWGLALVALVWDLGVALVALARSCGWPWRPWS